MAKKFERIMPGVYLVGKSESNPGIVYFRRMFNGKRIIRKATLQGAMATDVRGRPTKALKQEAANWTASLMNKTYMEKREGLKEMKFADLIREYKKAAELERVKSGKPAENTVDNNTRGLRRLIKEAGLSEEDKCSKMNVDLIDITITKLIQKGLEKITAWSYATTLQVVAPRWASSYYRHAGFKHPHFEMPSKRNMRPARYVRPTKEQLESVKQWYEGLWSDADKRKWMAATLMLQFAMRNGDVELAKPEWFEKREVKTRDGEFAERMVLHYTPHKTSSSSARSVAWPVEESLWRKIEQARKEIERAGKAAMEGSAAERKGCHGWWKAKGEEQIGKLIPFAHITYMRINQELRKIFPDSQKASYELRKICVDHVYQKLGPEKASAISGDDLKTVTYYYADPSQAVEQEGIDIAELL